MNPTQVIFTPPAANKDNSPIAPGEIAKYRVAVGLVPTDGSAQSFPTIFDDLDVTPSPDGTISVPIDDLGPLVPGSYAAIVIAITSANPPVSSDPSPVGFFTIAAPVVTPNPPSAPKFV